MPAGKHRSWNRLYEDASAGFAVAGSAVLTLAVLVVPLRFLLRFDPYGESLEPQPELRTGQLREDFGLLVYIERRCDPALGPWPSPSKLIPWPFIVPQPGFSGFA